MFWINPKLSFPDWRYPQYLYSNHLFVIIMIRSWNHLTLFPLFLYLSYLFPQSHSFVYCLELMIISDMITTYTYVTAATVVIANKILSSHSLLVPASFQLVICSPVLCYPVNQCTVVTVQ